MTAIIPFVLQGLILVIDEFWCHHQRDLGRWERLGHPVDTLTFVAALFYLLISAPSTLNLYVFAAIGLASCLTVTKDEWEHSRACDGFENWLHSCLFMLHPTLLIWAGHLWWTNDPRFDLAVGGATASALMFAVYQIIYWNVWRPHHDRQRIL